MHSCIPEPAAFQDQGVMAVDLGSAAPNAKPTCRGYQSVICAEELQTPIDTTIQHETPSSTDKNVVDRLFQPAFDEIPTLPA